MKKFLMLSLIMSAISIPAMADLQYSCSDRSKLSAVNGPDYTLTVNADGSIHLDSMSVSGNFTRKGSASGKWVTYNGQLDGKINTTVRNAILQVQYPLISGTAQGEIKIDKTSYTCGMLMKKAD